MQFVGYTSCRVQQIRGMVEQAARVAAKQAAREHESIEYLDAEDVDDNATKEQQQEGQDEQGQQGNEQKAREVLATPKEYRDANNNTVVSGSEDASESEQKAKSDIKKAQTQKIQAMIEEAKAQGAPW